MPLQPGQGYSSTLEVRSDGWAVLWTGGHLAGAGLVAHGVLVLVTTAGWLLGRRAGTLGRRVGTPGPRSSRPVLALGVVGCLLVLGGIAVVLLRGPDALPPTGRWQVLSTAASLTGPAATDGAQELGPGRGGRTVAGR